MGEWRNQEGGYSEEDDAGKQRVKRSEEFSSISMQNIHRTIPVRIMEAFRSASIQLSLPR